MRLRLALSGEDFPISLVGDFEGVGLLRGEYLCRLRNEYVTLQSCQNAIINYLTRSAEAFYPKPVWYRFIELETTEANILDGVDVLIDEDVPRMGMRGIRRAMHYPKTFDIELAAVCSVAEKWSNVNLLIPFVRDAIEVEFVRDKLDTLQFKNKLGMMVEIPSAVISLDQCILAGRIDEITVGMNDLTSMMLGVSRALPQFNFTHPAMLQVLAEVHNTARLSGVVASVAGYLNRTLIDVCQTIGYDFAILHYSALPNLLGSAYESLPGLDTLQVIKKQTRSRIAARDVSAKPSATL